MEHTIEECISIMDHCDGTINGLRCEGCPAYNENNRNCCRGSFDKDIKQYLSELKALNDGIADGEQLRNRIKEYNAAEPEQSEVSVKNVLKEHLDYLISCREDLGYYNVNAEQFTAIHSAILETLGELAALPTEKETAPQEDYTELGFNIYNLIKSTKDFPRIQSEVSERLAKYRSSMS